MNIQRLNTSCLLFVALCVVLLYPGISRAEELRLSVNASMAEVVKELGAVFSSDTPQVRLLPNFASSGALAQQLAAGAPADIFISANQEWMTFTVEQGVVAADSIRTLAYNRLVVAGRPRDGVEQLSDLSALQRIVIGSPESSPAGRYAQQALDQVGLYEPLLAAGKLILAKDVRQAVLYADRGEVDAAIIYATDARLGRRTEIFFEVPKELYPPILYPIGLTVSGQEKATALKFMEFLSSDSARAIFLRYGFLLAD